MSTTGPKFFIPGEEGGSVETEQCYEALRQTVLDDTALTPNARRIFSLSCRYGGRDCVMEVGQTAHGTEGAVRAIFDVGGDKPYCVYLTTGEPLRLGRRLYAITEFRKH